MVGEHLAKVINPSFIEEVKRYERVYIPDIPFMFSEDGAVVCIPRTQETWALGICGSSGVGKTLVFQRIGEDLFLHQGYNVCIMNDYQDETYEWNEPMKCKEFNDYNYMVNQSPLGLPIFHLYQNTDTLDLDVQKTKKINYLKITIPFRQVIDDIGFYMAGVNPEFDLGKSGMYINDLKEELLKCETASQIKEVLISSLPGQDGKSFQAMRIKAGLENKYDVYGSN